MKTSRSFSADPGSTRSARHFVLHAVPSAPPGLRDAIAVMTGELAMNAVQHARTSYEVTVELAGGTLRVDVTDPDGACPAAGPMPPPSSSHGRGLPIVDGLADDWGITPAPHGPGKSIWFTIAVPSPAPHARASALLRGDETNDVRGPQAAHALIRLVSPAGRLLAGLPTSKLRAHRAGGLHCEPEAA